MEGESWGWWFFSVVLLSVLLNVISAYIKPHVDVFLEKSVTYYRTRNAERRKRIEVHASAMLDDQAEVTLWATQLLSTLLVFIAITILLYQLFILFILLSTNRINLAFFPSYVLPTFLNIARLLPSEFYRHVGFWGMALAMLSCSLGILVGFNSCIFLFAVRQEYKAKKRNFTREVENGDEDAGGNKIADNDNKPNCQ